MKFYPYSPIDKNKAHNFCWKAIQDAFGKDEGASYYRYPIFIANGQRRSEPDIVMVHRALGIWIFECKGCLIKNIKEIQGHEWIMSDFYSESLTPIAQVEDQMYALKNRLDSRRETRGFMTFHYRVCIPLISHNEWNNKGFGDFPSTDGVVLLKEDMQKSDLQQHIEEGNKHSPQRELDDSRWEIITAALGGTLPEKEPRKIPTGTPQKNPVRVIKTIESELKVLDEQQQKVAYEIPDGPQRIRGLAGTGKTVLFARRAARIHAKNPDWNIAFIFFTQALYGQIIDLIKSAFHDMTGEEPDWTKIHVMHAWGSKERKGLYRTLAKQSGLIPLSVNKVKERQGKMSPAEAFDYICTDIEQKKGNNIPQIYEAILIDEGQDLPASFYRIAKASLKAPFRLYWSYDEAQGIGSLIVPRAKEIFGENDNGEAIVDIQGMYEGGILKSHTLNRCYRTPKLHLMLAHAINMGLYREGGPLQGVTEQKEWSNLGYEVLEGDFSSASIKAGKILKIHRDNNYSSHPIDKEHFDSKESIGELLSIQKFNSEEEEQEWIAQQVSSDIKAGMIPSDIMITGPEGNNQKSYFNELKIKLEKVKIESIIAGIDTPKDIFRLDGKVTISSIFRAKGNETWKVYICRFHYANDPLQWKNESELHKRNEAFVALTRAKVWSVVTGIDGPIMNELEKAKQNFPYLVFKAFNKSSLKRINDENQ